MQHIKQAMANTLENSSKAKFFHGMEEIIKEKTKFRVEDFLGKLK